MQHLQTCMNSISEEKKIEFLVSVGSEERSNLEWKLQDKNHEVNKHHWSDLAFGIWAGLSLGSGLTGILKSRGLSWHQDSPVQKQADWEVLPNDTHQDLNCWCLGNQRNSSNTCLWLRYYVPDTVLGPWGHNSEPERGSPCSHCTHSPRKVDRPLENYGISSSAEHCGST